LQDPTSKKTNHKKGLGGAQIVGLELKPQHQKEKKKEGKEVKAKAREDIFSKSNRRKFPPLEKETRSFKNTQKTRPEKSLSKTYYS
jgi:hypothetical protein